MPLVTKLTQAITGFRPRSREEEPGVACYKSNTKGWLECWRSSTERCPSCNTNWSPCRSPFKDFLYLCEAAAESNGRARWAKCAGRRNGVPIHGQDGPESWKVLIRVQTKHVELSGKHRTGVPLRNVLNKTFKALEVSLRYHSECI